MIEKKDQELARGRTMGHSVDSPTAAVNEPSVRTVPPKPLFRCRVCGYEIGSPGLCGECACEDDGAIW